jgi:hypothetical protein
MRILLGQLGANGDCLYATVLARQIKEDYPGCHLTWAISRQCRQILSGNPHVDEVWEWDATDWAVYESAWCALETEVLRIQTGPHPFDKVVLSQIWPNNYRTFDGTIRPSLLRAYDRPITVPIDSVIVLNEREEERVEGFVGRRQIANYRHAILFECSSMSKQSYVTPDFALRVAEGVGKRLKDCCFIISSHQPIAPGLRNVFSAHELGMRENAALTHHCSLFVGCGSGLTVVATSGAAKELPNIQLLSNRTSVFASFFHDFEFWGKPSGRFIEMGDATEDMVREAIVLSCQSGLDTARAAYHRPLPVTFDFYLEIIDEWLVGRCKYLEALDSLAVTSRRYGWNDTLLNYARKKILPVARFDSLLMNPRAIERLEEHTERIRAV